MAATPPFDTARLDRLMHEAGVDVLLATSKHAVQYLLGGHRAHFFDTMDAMGTSRYLPVFVYLRDAPERAGYVGHRLETHQQQAEPLWVSHVRTDSWGSVDAIEKAVAFIGSQDTGTGRIAIEDAFLPADSARALARLVPAAELVDALPILERLRLRKTGAELDHLREASERVAAAMAEVFEACRPGMTKRDLVQHLREAETARGLVFDYCLIAAGSSLNRAPSDQPIGRGDVISLDSGGNYHGYIGDIARMGIVGEPDAELVAMLDTIEAVQQAAFRACHPGAPGSGVYATAEALIAASPLAPHLHFLAHGMGLVSHEAPHLTKSGPVPYADIDAHLPLEPGTVLSIETTLRHPARGFIKLEDTVAVSETGYEVFGDVLRGWNRTGARPAHSRAA